MYSKCFKVYNSLKHLDLDKKTHIYMYEHDIYMLYLDCGECKNDIMYSSTRTSFT